MAELEERVSWPEFMGWIAFYAWEAEQEIPPEKRVKRPRSREDAAAEMDRAFGIRRN